ncbi:hypothetical protein HG531_009522 [Fusarium graminearum]|nr:hypothetical protein HG531_009522 [Fusarium graminearum]
MGECTLYLLDVLAGKKLGIRPEGDDRNRADHRLRAELLAASCGHLYTGPFVSNGDHRGRELVLQVPEQDALVKDGLGQAGLSAFELVQESIIGDAAVSIVA